jgi:hypothetical protein
MLRLVLEPQGLSYHVDSGVIIISPREKADLFRCRDELARKWQALAESRSVATNEQLAKVKIDREFPDVALPAILDFFHDALGMDIILEASAMRYLREGHTAVPLSVKDLELGEVLRLLLFIYGLFYRVENGAVLVGAEGAEAVVSRLQLEKPIPTGSVEFANAALLDIVEYVRDFFGVNVVLDPGVGDPAALSVSLKMESASLPDILCFLEESLGIACLAENGSLVLAHSAVAFKRRAALVQSRLSGREAKTDVAPAWREELEKKLSVHIDMNFADAELSAILDVLRQHASLDIEVQDEPETKRVLSFQCRELEIRSALKLLLMECDMDYRLEAGKVVIFKP